MRDAKGIPFVIDGELYGSICEDILQTNLLGTSIQSVSV